MASDDRTSERAYRRTHPWITFTLDLSRASYTLWLNLGAVQSKLDHVANVILAPGEARRLHEIYLAKGVRATTAIEGNTLTEQEVRERIASQKPLPPSREYLGREVDNIVRACNAIADWIVGGQGESATTAERIKGFNSMVLDGLPLEPWVVPGEVSRAGVHVGGYSGAPREDCEHLLQRLCEWLTSIAPPDSENSLSFAVLRAVMAHLYIAWIHPFGDGNGRTARLVEVQILLSAGVPTIAAHLLSDFYNQTRAEYYRQLSQASRSGGNVIPFLEYAVRGLMDKLDLQIKRIRRFQQSVTWRVYVYDRFGGKHSPAADRRRQLAIDLGSVRANAGSVRANVGRGKKWVDVRKIPELTTRLARLYAAKTSKTLSRDINELQSMGLVERAGGRVAANVDLLQAFLPRRRPDSKP